MRIISLLLLLFVLSISLNAYIEENYAKAKRAFLKKILIY